MREWIYGVGSPKANEDIYKRKYLEHNHDVMKYFEGRSNDFLILRITEGEGWEKLCPFLHRETPDQPFPYANRAEDRENSEDSWKAKIDRIKNRYLGEKE